MTTNILGDPQAYYGNIVLGGVTQTTAGQIGMAVLVQDSKTLLVQFTRSVDVSAFSPARYTLLPVDYGAFIPVFTVTGFADAGQTGVYLSFSQSLTFGKHYTLACAGVLGMDGLSEADTAYNFLATVPDPPRQVGAYVSGLGQIDVVYDRPVAASNPTVTATIADVGFSTPLTLVPYVPGLYPANNLRFAFSSFPTTGPDYSVSVGPVADISSNVSSASSVLLTQGLRAPKPLSLSGLNQIQITDAFVAHVSSGFAQRGFISVYFNAPLFRPDATDLTRWSVVQSGAHSTYDSYDIVVGSPPVDLFTIINLALAFQTAYNTHLGYPGVHVVPDDGLPSEVDVIRLTNSLIRAYAIHSAKGPSGSAPFVHSLADPFIGPDGSSAIRPARTFADAVTLLNLLRIEYDAHRTKPGVHANDDFVYAVLQPKASDLRSATLLADELRSKIQMHVTSSYWHALPDPSDVPNSGYIYGPSIYESPTNLLMVAGLINELQDKYLQHVSDDVVHLYSDDINTFSTTGLSLTQDDFVTENVQQSADTLIHLQAFYNAHLAPSYPTPLYSVRSYATGDESDVTDQYTYMCVLEVKSTSFAPVMTVQTTVRDSTLTSQAVQNAYSGQIVARPLTGAPKLLSATSFPGGKLRLRFDRELQVRNLSEYSIRSFSGLPKSIASAVPTASIHCLNVLLNDVLTAFSHHVNLAGHRAIDVSHDVSSGDYPIGSLGDLVRALNAFKAKFNDHAVNSLFHQRSSPAPVLTPNATDLDSCYVLAQALASAVIDHNRDLVLHTSSSPETIAARRSDEVAVDLGDAFDGGKYDVRFPATDRIISLGGTAPAHSVTFDVPFSGLAQHPYLASAVSRTGLVQKDDGSFVLGQDSVVLYFSKAMTQQDPSRFVSFTGGVHLSKMAWLSSRSLSVQASGLGTSSYGVSTSGLTDTSGNST